ncbi:MAG TPA: acyl carrier protein [Stellaceae bacterium]|nr:acyl carrier protein [Stellaceae bacterium]
MISKGEGPAVSRSEILVTLGGYLQDMFEVPADKITPTARLFDDLDLDSIDAVDLVVKLQEYTGRKIAPAEFKSVRTIGDVVEKVYAQLSQGT